MAGLPVDQFSEWLHSVSLTFRCLSIKQQSDTLHVLLEQSEPLNRYCMTKSIKNYFKKDIVVSLPFELQEHIFQYLDGTTLLTCCEVSENWDRVISVSLSWKKCCYKIGASLPLQSPLDSVRSTMWKDQFQEAFAISSGLSSHPETILEATSLTCPTVDCDNFTVLSYDEGYLVAANQTNTICVWNVDREAFQFRFNIEPQVSSLRYRSPNHLVCGHHNGTLTYWTFERNLKASTLWDSYVGLSKLITKFSLHDGTVLTLDFCTKANLLVSGSADNKVKLWCLSSGALLRSISHSHWVTSVVLKRKACEQDVVVIAMTKNEIIVYKVLKSNESDDISDTSVALEITLPCVSNFFTPGLHFLNNLVAYPFQKFVPSACRDAQKGKIIGVDVDNKKPSDLFVLNYPLRKLLAIGDRFLLLLLPWKANTKPNLIFVDRVTQKKFGSFTIPHSRTTTPDLANVTFGNPAWLNGLSKNNCSGLLVALASDEGGIFLVKWRT